MQDQGHDAELPGKLPAYWPAACLASSMDDPPADFDLQPLEVPPLSHSRSGSDDENPQAEGIEAGGVAASAGKQHLKTYAELLSEETAAMKNAVGPWQPRVEKSSKLMVRVLSMPVMHSDASYVLVCILIHQCFPSLHVSHECRSRLTDKLGTAPSLSAHQGRSAVNTRSRRKVLSGEGDACRSSKIQLRGCAVCTSACSR